MCMPPSWPSLFITPPVSWVGMCRALDRWSRSLLVGALRHKSSFQHTWCMYSWAKRTVLTEAEAVLLKRKPLWPSRDLNRDCHNTIDPSLVGSEDFNLKYASFCISETSFSPSTVLFTNGSIPYTYQNGMAVFSQDGGGAYPVAQAQVRQEVRIFRCLLLTRWSLHFSASARISKWQGYRGFLRKRAGGSFGQKRAICIVQGKTWKMDRISLLLGSIKSFPLGSKRCGTLLKMPRRSTTFCVVGYIIGKQSTIKLHHCW
jgi:hypothetical protein